MKKIQGMPTNSNENWSNKCGFGLDTNRLHPKRHTMASGTMRNFHIRINNFSTIEAFVNIFLFHIQSLQVIFMLNRKCEAMIKATYY